MSQHVLFENTKPTKLFWMVTIPGIISMLVSSLYYTIDGIFVGQVLGADAFAALSLALPLVIINFSVADLIGVGSAVHISLKLGEKDEPTACSIFTSACLLIVIASTILGGILFFFAEDILHLMGANKVLVDLGSQYLKTYAICSPLTTSMFAVDNYLRICGRVHYSMFLNIFMSVLCAVIEFVFLFLFGFGIWGAALACCIGIGVSTILGFLPFLRGNMQLRFVKPVFRPKMLFLIISSGLPTFLNNIAGRLFSLIMNVVLLHIGGAPAVTAYSVLLFADGFVQPVLYGLCDSLQPAIGYNWGAKNYRRVKALIYRCVLACATISIAMTVSIFLGKSLLVALFIPSPDSTLLKLSSQALEIGCFAYLTRWISLAGQSLFSAIGHAAYATIISVSMALFFPLVLLVILKDFGLTGLWLNLPLTCLLSAFLCVILYLFWKGQKIRLPFSD
ncbi:MAG: MATE family efflux transporter [Lachnospiraceae bacterium]